MCERSYGIIDDIDNVAHELFSRGNAHAISLFEVTSLKLWRSRSNALTANKKNH